ncbi:MAG: hypothetical protein EPN70_00750 [Paraburkholderia sp.]|uniref:hypothetical protein n=1 Tax=Paraburkholderia sp. TaxID=1926495 RepID=UPI0011F9DAA1|nr:hypothetical protein [Paraburkholderia sp.]TAM08302.1 MAG: hypothetical protein EPN70_00750 [Paraburkholderia sp.]
MPEIEKQARAVAARIAEEIAQIDQALHGLDELLNFLQPPHTGKIRIEWWKRNGRLVPQPVVWRHSAAGWRAERVPVAGLSRRVRSAREFHDNQKQVRAVCQNVTKLLTMREQTLAPLAMFRRTTSGTLNTNRHRLVLAIAGIDIALATMRAVYGVSDSLTVENAEGLANE